jgi:hypothetical protein
MRVLRNLGTKGGRRRYARKLEFPGFVFGVFLFVLAGTLYVVTPEAPGRDTLRLHLQEPVAAYVETRTTDQFYANCAEARADGRSNIPARDPSYRERMDGDGDGLACEPYR